MFLFELNSGVMIATSGETGTVIGRAEYVASEPNYCLRYKTAQGVAEQSWWPESALVPVATDPDPAA